MADKPNRGDPRILDLAMMLGGFAGLGFAGLCFAYHRSALRRGFPRLIV
jgi:hypothetical protein